MLSSSLNTTHTVGSTYLEKEMDYIDGYQQIFESSFRNQWARVSIDKVK